ncbi:adenine deaminase [Haloterrigena sp. SYSU A558-1]|uniref:adenine deaminase n=1 Tax=Haloterrigena gelatinilytica TaxID=2741724 RepID=A0ABX2L8J1_9EURY|nr:adenine deaminase C-terminal domain-containing protein [Haloterrigena gelatinilytica]NUC71494.1 adenine deaminase [Haloterrigena gelatinilytica]
MNELQPVALEREGATADLVVANGRVYVSNRREFLERDVAVVGDRIAALLPDSESVTGPDTTVVDASDRVVLPGLIDAHTHADIQVTPERAAPAMLAGGTTSIVTETSGLGLLFGSRGVEFTLERTADLPVTAYLTLPPQWFVDTFEPARGDDADLEAFVDLLERERVVGVGEIDWIHVVGRESPVERLYDRARDADATIVGHGAGCRGESLRAFATVVDNDHEAIEADGIRERAEHGIHVVGRCGSNRDDIDALAAAVPDVDRGSVSLSTDGVWPADLVDGVGMADVVRRAIEAGVPERDAIDAATRNPAEHFGLEGRGVVAPGAFADLLVVDDLESMTVQTVVADGAVVVVDGTPAVEPRTDPYPDSVTDTVSVDCDADRFTAPLEAAPDGVVRAMEVGRGLVTTETTAEPAVLEAGERGDGAAATDARLGPDPDADVLTATLIDRDPATDDRAFTGFLVGYGLERGAVATSAVWETPGLATVAADADDAVAAAERVAELGGGFAVARDGAIVADLPMPVGATAADAAVEDVAAGVEALEATLRESGVDVADPLLTVQTLTFVGVPTLKLTASGYADVLGRSRVGLEPTADPES